MDGVQYILIVMNCKLMRLVEAIGVVKGFVLPTLLCGKTQFGAKDCSKWWIACREYSKIMLKLERNLHTAL